MKITLCISCVENGDGKCEPYRLTETHTESKIGCEKIAAEIQSACIEATEKVLNAYRSKKDTKGVEILFAKHYGNNCGENWNYELTTKKGEEK